MSQVSAKAAVTRAMAYWLLEVCRRADMSHPVYGAHNALRAAMLKCFVDADILCRRSGRIFSPAQHAKFSRLVERGLVAYNALAVEALSQNIKNWKVVPKFHALIHIAASRNNPRRQQCYDDEDIVGKIKRIFVKCHAATASRRALQRYAMMLTLRWWEFLHHLRLIQL